VRSTNQAIDLPLLNEKQVSLALKREDLIHPLVSGNKYRKLKYNLIAATAERVDTILTFGGAYSNHIAATAYAGRLHGFNTIGVIRGEELAEKWKDNQTLKLAHENGMRFKFISRNAYRNKYTEASKKKLDAEFGPFYLLPEGGSNTLAVKGCEEIITEDDIHFDVICSSVGTGGTLAGIINAANQNQRVLGFPSLKGDFLKEDIRNFTAKKNWQLQTDYHFGGYAKVSETLIHFINEFKSQTQIPLDPIYTGKMIYGILDLMKKNYFKPKTKILAIHTGGLQSIKSMNEVLKKKKLPQISI